VNAEREQLEARLKKAREEHAPFERAREERAEIDRLRREVELAEQRAKDAPHIAKAEEEHGLRCAVYETAAGAVVVKRPPPLHYRRFQSQSNISSDEMLKLVKSSLVYPDARRLEEILDEQPGALMPLANLVVELAGHRHAEVEKK
jgi:hypothetical protein